MDLAGSPAEYLLARGRGDLAFVGAAFTADVDTPDGAMADFTVDVVTRDVATLAADEPTPGAEGFAAGTATVMPVGAEAPLTEAVVPSVVAGALSVEADMPSAAVGAATVEADMPSAAVGAATVEAATATEAADTHMVAVDTVPMEAEAVTEVGAGKFPH
jgi:hypothetical protein